MRSSTTRHDISGWIIVDKPTGITSAAVVHRVRQAFNARKAGHAGTLDPDATGVLALALGHATKTIPFVTDALKTYRFAVRLGQSTTTDDASGDIIAHSTFRPTNVEINNAIPSFIGDIEQIPPQFSAVRIQGKRAYHLARDGQNVTLAARKLWVEDLKMTDRRDSDHITLEMTCGKGGYVRSIARDLGEKLGCLAHVCDLRRLRTGIFSLSDALPLSRIEELEREGTLSTYLRPIESPLTDLVEIRCTPRQAERLIHGNPVTIHEKQITDNERVWASLNGKIVALGTFRHGQLHPSRVVAVCK